MTGELRRAMNRLNKTLDDLKFYQDDHVQVMDLIERAERQIADMRAIAETEPQVKRIEHRYGTTEPKSIRDWWQS